MFDKDGRGHYEEMITIIKRFIDKDNSASNWIIDTHKLAPRFFSFITLTRYEKLDNFLSLIWTNVPRSNRRLSELIVDTDGRKERFQMFLCDLK